MLEVRWFPFTCLDDLLLQVRKGCFIGSMITKSSKENLEYAIINSENKGKKPILGQETIKALVR